jgi:hypothetical protein
LSDTASYHPFPTSSLHTGLNSARQTGDGQEHMSIKDCISQLTEAINRANQFKPQPGAVNVPVTSSYADLNPKSFTLRKGDSVDFRFISPTDTLTSALNGSVDMHFSPV